MEGLHEFYTKHLLDSIAESPLLSACTVLPPHGIDGKSTFSRYGFDTGLIPYKQRSLPRVFLYDSPSLSTPEGRAEFELRVWKYIHLLVQAMERQVLAYWPSFQEFGATHCISTEPCFLPFGMKSILVEKEGVKKYIRVEKEKKLKITFHSNHPDFLHVSALPIVHEFHQYRLNGMYYIHHQDGADLEAFVREEEEEDEYEDGAEAVMAYP